MKNLNRPNRQWSISVIDPVCEKNVDKRPNQHPPLVDDRSALKRGAKQRRIRRYSRPVTSWEILVNGHFVDGCELSNVH